MKLFYQYMAIFLNFLLTLTYLHSLQVGKSGNYFIVRFRNLRPPYQPHTIYNIARFYIFQWQILITIFNILSSSQLFHSSNSFILSSYCIIFFMYIFSMSVFFHFLCLLLCQGEQLVATAVCNPYVK